MTARDMAHPALEWRCFLAADLRVPDLRLAVAEARALEFLIAQHCEDAIKALKQGPQA